MAWAVGVLEVLGLIVFVGYSITYTLHVAHKHLCFALVFFLRWKKRVWKVFGKMVVWEEWWWKFCAAGNDETLIKPCDFGGGVASGLTEINSRLFTGGFFSGLY